MIVSLTVILAACGEAPPVGEPTSTPSTTSTTSTTVSSSDGCGDRFPIFYPGLEPVEGIPGPGPDGSPPSDGQLARHWFDESLGLSIDARWPAEATDDAPDDAETYEEFPIVEREQLEDGVRMIVRIPGPEGCDHLEVEVHAGEELDPVQDFMYSFAQDIRPIDELDAYLNPPPPEPFLIPSDLAVMVVEQFLEAAGTGAWDIAAGLLINEGMAPEVEAKLGGGLGGDVSIEELLEDYCVNALCSAPYEIIDVEQFDGASVVTVGFQASGGRLEWPVRVGQFEGILTLGDLPPPGSGPDRTSFSQRIFGSEERFAAIWYNAAQIIDGSSGQWAPWWLARFGNPDVLNRWGLSNYIDSINIEDLAGEFAAERLERNNVFLHGSGTFGGREVAYLLEDFQDRLLEVDIASLTVEPVIDSSDQEGFLGGADAAADTLAVISGVGDSLWVEFYDLDLELITSTRDSGFTYTSVALDPDGELAAVGFETELHMPRNVALVEVATGRQLDSWTGPSDGVVGDVDYDGRFIVAPIGYPDDPDRLPELLVVDSRSGEASIVRTSARIDLS